MATRHERVVLDLEDRFAPGIREDAASVALLRRELASLSGTAVKTSRSTRAAEQNITATGTSARKSGDGINQLTGRLRLFADLAATLGPGLLPIAAVGVPAVTGLATALTAGATAGIGMMVALGGVGDALDAVEKARLDPTVENLEAARDAMAQLGPDAANFVTEFQALRPVLREIRDAAAAGLFPGLTESLDDFEELAPRISTLLYEVNRASGEVIANGVESLTTERWTPFLDFLTAEMPAALTSLSKIVGDLTHGAALMWMEFDPSNDAFLAWLEDVASAFDDWAASAQGRESIAAFLDYVRQTGPQVQETFVAIVDALTQIVQAAAPLGGPVLQGVEAVADVLGAIADTDLGTPILAGVAALVLYNRTAKITGAVMATSLGSSTLGAAKTSLTGMGTALIGVASAQDRASKSSTAFAAAEKERSAAIRGGLGTLGKSAGLLGGLAIASSGAADGMGLTNTASLALMGTMAGPWGAAIGAGVGLLLDFKAGQAESAAEVAGFTATLNQQTGALTDNSRAWAVKALDDAGALDAAERFGLSLPMVTDAALGNADAIRFLQEEMAQYSIELDENGNYVRDYTDAEIAAFKAAGDLLSGVLGTSGVVAQSAEDFRQTNAAMQEYESGNLNAAEAAAAAKAEINGLVEAMRNQTSAALTAFDAQTRWGEAVQAAREQAATGAQGLNEMTDAGVANRNALSRLAAEWSTQPKAVKNSTAAYDDARRTFIDVAIEMGVGRRRARELADSLLEVPRKTVAKIEADDKEARQKTRDAKKALDTLAGGFYQALILGDPSDLSEAVRTARGLLNDINGDTATTYINTVRSFSGPDNSLTTPSGAGADGGTVHGRRTPYGDKELYAVAPGEEIVSNRYGQADKNRAALKAANAGAKLAVVGFADGGQVFGARYLGRGANGPAAMAGGRSIDARLEILQVMQEIRDLRRQLAADGKDRLKGINRRIADLQLDAAQKELRLAKNAEARETRANLRGVASGFSLDSLVPGPEPTVEQNARGQVADFRRQIREAGGVWSKALERWSKGLIASASAYDGVQRAIERETAKREALAATLDTQQRALDNLTSTMAAYSSSVAGNFLGNPFNKGGTRPGVAGPQPMSAELAAAEAELIAIRASSGGDSTAAAAAASRLIVRVKELRAQQEATQAAEQTVTGLQALRETLEADTKAALEFAESLNVLRGKGLDTTGDLGGLYQQLASSGDFATAAELAELSAAQIDEYEKLFAAREDAAAAVAALATQAVYGEQQAQMIAAVAATTAAIESVDATLADLNRTAARLGAQVRDGAEDGVKALEPQLRGIKQAIKDIPRRQAEDRRRAANR